MSQSTARFETPGSVRRQTGAALVVGLILMLVLTLLGISGMGMATLELTMAGNADLQQEAFQAAESGIDIPLGQRDFRTAEVTTFDAPLDAEENYRAQSKTECVLTTPVPDIAFSMGTSNGSVQAFHFDIVSVGTTKQRGATSTHTQSFYVIGPGGVGC